MTQPAIAAEIHQPLDIHRDLATKIAFHDIVAVDHFAHLQHFLVGELRHAALLRNADLGHDVLGGPLADAVDVLKRNHNALVGRNIHTGNTSHRSTPVSWPKATPLSVSPYGGNANVKTTPFPLPQGPGIVLQFSD